jgi:asparagine synthetase A
MKKLVKKNLDGRLLEIDTKALRREAAELKAKIEIASDEEQRKFDYRRKLLPLIDAALNGTLVFPYMHSPYNLRE